MFTLALVSDRLNLNTPWGIVIIYLGFGAGLAVFMFCGFVKSIPLEIEEAAMIDGCGSVRKIASESGFSDALYFSKVFKKKVGVTPSEKIKQRE